MAVLFYCLIAILLIKQYNHPTSVHTNKTATRNDSEEEKKQKAYIHFIRLYRRLFSSRLLWNEPEA